MTSYFVAAHEAGTASEYYGLDSMAELIIQLYRKEYERKQYLDYLQVAFQDKMSKSVRSILERRMRLLVEAVELRVVRFAGGQPARAVGFWG